MLVSRLREQLQFRTTTEIDAMDSYTSSGSATSNYGGASWLIIGNQFSSWCSGYMYFNFSGKPANVQSAIVYVDMYSISATTNFTVSIVNNSWTETGITYLNSPALVQVIGNFLASTLEIIPLI